MTNLATLLHGFGNSEYITGFELVYLNFASHKTYSLTPNIASLVDYFMIYSNF